MENINEDKVKENIEIKKAREMDIAETINTKEGYNKRNIISTVK